MRLSGFQTRYRFQRLSLTLTMLTSGFEGLIKYSRTACIHSQIGKSCKPIGITCPDIHHDGGASSVDRPVRGVVANWGHDGELGSNLLGLLPKSRTDQSGVAAFL